MIFVRCTKHWTTIPAIGLSRGPLPSGWIPSETPCRSTGPTFVDWRYAGEDKALNTNPSDLDEAVEVMMAVYEEAKTT